MLLKGIIFDFDGVISESIKVKTNAFSVLYNNFGQKIVQKVIRHHIDNGGMSRYEKFKYYHSSFLNINLSELEVEKLSKQFSKLVVEKVIEAPFVLGVLEFIKKNYLKYNMFISTGTPLDEILEILKHKKINKYFKGIYGSPDDKNSHILDIIKQYNINPNEMIFFGDSYTDIKAARRNNIKIIVRVHKDNKKSMRRFDGDIISNFKNLKISNFIT